MSSTKPIPKVQRIVISYHQSRHDRKQMVVYKIYKGKRKGRPYFESVTRHEGVSRLPIEGFKLS